MLNPLHIYIPSPIAFHIGPLSIHWYGLFLMFAILIGYFIVIKLSKKSNLKEEEISSLFINVLIAGLIGARIYHVLGEFSFYRNNLGEILAIWNGGLAIHGAIIGAVLMVFYYTRSHKQDFWKIVDIFVIPSILGQAIGRWGNYFNQELFGKPTDAGLGIPIDIAHRPIEFIQNTHFHPTFLYESLINLVIFGILLFVFKKQTSQRLVGLWPKRSSGMVFWMYIVLYSLGRIVVESLRINQAAMIGLIRLPLLVSVLLAILSAVMILKTLTFKHKKE